MELRQYLRIFAAHWLGMVLIVLLALGATFAWTLLQPRVYQADSSAIVQVLREDDDPGSAMVGNTLANQRVSTIVDLGSSRSVADRVIDDLGMQTTPQSLVTRVSVSNPRDTLSIRVTASAATPEAARDLAEAWVRAMTAELNALDTGDASTSGLVYLEPIDSARLPTAPSSPNTRLSLAIGGLVGLALAIGYALLRYTLDRRIRSVSGVEHETGVAVVGTVPEEKSFTPTNRLMPFDGGTSASSSKAHLFAIAESMRELRTNIQFMDVDNPPRVIVVTSPLPGDGKSTIASNLAIALATNGQRTILIDGDLRRPMISTIFNLVDGAGVADILAGRAAFADVAQPVGGNGELLVVAAGKVPPNPSEVLGSARMRELLVTLSRDAIVIIDAPPLIPVTDAAILAHSADGAIVVGTVGKTTYEVLGKALGNLERAKARCLGVVLNRVPRRGSGAAYYGYQYQGEYYRAAEGEPADASSTLTPPESAPDVADGELRSRRRRTGSSPRVVSN